MKILITGGLGHLGSKLIRDLANLNKDSLEILIVDNCMTQRVSSLFNLPKRDGLKYKFIEQDLTEGFDESLLVGVDYIVQLAALTEAQKSMFSPDIYEEINLKVTRNIAEVCSERNISLIFPSTCSVYTPSGNYVDENSTGKDLCGQSPYAKIKLKEEELLKELGDDSNLKFTVVRLGTIAGVSPGMRFHTAVNSFCWNAVKGKPLNIWETAINQKRPYLSLNDFTRAVSFVIENNIFDNQIYNVLNGNLTVNDIINILSKYVSTLEVQKVKSDIMNELSYEVDRSKFTSLGFEYESSLDLAIRDTMELFAGLL